MDNNPQLVKPMSDDQELAKVLAGINQQTDQPVQFDAPVAADPVTLAPDAAPEPDVAPSDPVDDTPAVVDPPMPSYEPPVVNSVSSPADDSSDLTSIKKDALNDLRPLVGKLDIPSEEKFDTYLLLIRSTDDKTLIAPAYAAAQAITDEARKAQALLDVIKEIDYLSAPAKN
jgi:hypothetical protein